MNPWLPERDPKILRRVGKTGEEAAELAKVCSRIVIQGIDGIDPHSGRTNREELERELADVWAQMDLCIRQLNLDPNAITQRSRKKLDLMLEWEALVEPLEGDKK